MLKPLTMVRLLSGYSEYPFPGDSMDIGLFHPLSLLSVSHLLYIWPDPTQKKSRHFQQHRAAFVRHPALCRGDVEKKDRTNSNLSPRSEEKKELEKWKDGNAVPFIYLFTSPGAFYHVSAF